MTYISISASALKTFRDCPRKNYFERVLRLPRVPKGHFAFGTTYHAVVERWLGASEDGTDTATGQPVELYPDGWDDEISKVEAHQIQKLVAKSIEAGHLVRRPRMQIEAQVGMDPRTKQGEKFMVIDEDEVQVGMFGFIDVLEPDEITDHKTSKDMRYALSQAKLKNDTQMVCYGKYLIELKRKRGEVLPEFITLTHLVACKDPNNPEVRKTSVDVTPKHIDECWVEIQADARIMWQQAQEEDWTQIPTCSKDSGNCRKYGGCDFLDICGGRETPSSFSKKQDRLLAQRQKDDSFLDALSGGLPTNQQEDPMTLSKLKAARARLAANRNGTAKSTPEPQAADPVNGAIAVADEPEPEEVEQVETNPLAAPWYFDGCPACSSGAMPGLNSMGNPCRACVVNQEKVGGPTPSDFEQSTDENGDLCWIEKSTEETTKIETPKAKVSERTMEQVIHPDLPDDPPAPPKAAPKKDPEPEVVNGLTQPKDIVNGVKKAGRPKQMGLTVLIGCNMVKTGRDTILATDLLNRITEEIERVKGTPYENLDVWKRREAVQNYVRKVLAEELDKKVIVANVMSPEVNNMLVALQDIAVDVFQAGAL